MIFSPYVNFTPHFFAKEFIVIHIFDRTQMTLMTRIFTDFLKSKF